MSGINRGYCPYCAELPFAPDPPQFHGHLTSHIRAKHPNKLAEWDVRLGKSRVIKNTTPSSRQAPPSTSMFCSPVARGSGTPTSPDSFPVADNNDHCGTPPVRYGPTVAPDPTIGPLHSQAKETHTPTINSRYATRSSRISQELQGRTTVEQLILGANLAERSSPHKGLAIPSPARPNKAPAPNELRIGKESIEFAHPDYPNNDVLIDFREIEKGDDSHLVDDYRLMEDDDETDLCLYQYNCPESHHIVEEYGFNAFSRDEEGAQPPAQIITDDDSIIHLDKRLEPPLHYPATHDIYRRNCFTREDRIMLQLCKVLDKHGVPLYVLDDIIKVLKHEIDENVKFHELKFVQRRAFVKKMLRMFPVPEPDFIPVSLEGPAQRDIQYNRRPREIAWVVSYQFQEIIQELLLDPFIFGNISNLEGSMNTTATDPAMMFDPFTSELKAGVVDDVHTGRWYKRTVEMVKKRYPGAGVLVAPILLYTDKTGTDIMQRNPLEPVMVTTTLLNRKARNQWTSWRVLGFMPDLEAKSSAAKLRGNSTQKGVGRSLRNYHKCMAAILESMVKVQGFNGVPVKMHLRCGEYVQERYVVFPVAYVMGDGLSQDTVAGRKKNYTGARISRACNCSSDHADRPTHKCRYIPYHTIHKRCQRAMLLMGLADTDGDGNDTETLSRRPDGTHKPKAERERDVRNELRAILAGLKRVSQHVSDNAFAKVWFGDNPRGVTGATPVDMMHLFLHGIVRYVCKVFIEPLTATEKHELDLLVDQICRERSTMRREYPRVNFTKGITNLKLITASEWAGVLFTLALLSTTSRGYALFRSIAERNPIKGKEGGTTKEYSRKDELEASPHDLERLSLDDPKVQHVDPIDETKWVRGQQIFSELHTWENEKKEVLPDDEEPGVVQVEMATDEDYDPLLDDEVEPEDIDEDTDGGAYRAEENRGPCGPDRFLHVAQILLSFHAWYKRGGPHDLSTKEKRDHLMRAIRSLLNLVKEHLPRLDGNGWKLQKFHDLLHAVGEMMEFGSLQNTDVGVCESGLRFWAKLPAMTSQKVGGLKFNNQINDRLVASTCFNKAMHFLINPVFPIESQSWIAKEVMDESASVALPQSLEGKPIGSPTCKLVFQDNDPRGNPQIIRWRQSSQREDFDLHALVITLLRSMNQDAIQNSPTNQGIGTIEVYTEIVHDGKILRAHPNYKSGGPWYDWVMVNFDQASQPTAKKLKLESEERGTYNLKKDVVKDWGGAFKENLYAAKVLCFFKKSGEGEKIQAFVHPVEAHEPQMENTRSSFYKPDYRQTPLLRRRRKCYQKHPQNDWASKGIMVPLIWNVDIHTFGRHVYVVEDDPGWHECFSFHEIKENPDKYGRQKFSDLKVMSSDAVTIVADWEEHWPKCFLSPLRNEVNSEATQNEQGDDD